MASNKNQHFVPRCYLREFTYESQNKTVNIFNVDRRRVISTAPVKSQCSRDYFYGQNEVLENAIQSIEVSYASVLREIINGPRDLNEAQKTVLKRFWLFQYMRTEAASIRAVEMSNSIGETAGLSPEEYNLEIKEAVQMAMDNFAKSMSVVDDLKVCCFLNRTKVPLVTSDDPAALTNRWHIGDNRVKSGSFGLNSCGALIFLPLSPHIMCVGYDGDVYSVPHKKGWASINREEDISAFNQHQFLGCRANIFFRDMEDASFIEEHFQEIEERRPPENHRIHYAVFDYSDGQSSRYKVVDPREAGDHERAMMHIENVHALPLSWPSVVKWRNRGVVYTNGTALGYVRREQVLPHYEGFYKEPVKLKRKPKKVG